MRPKRKAPPLPPPEAARHDEDDIPDHASYVVSEEEARRWSLELVFTLLNISDAHARWH